MTTDENKPFLTEDPVVAEEVKVETPALPETPTLPKKLSVPKLFWVSNKDMAKATVYIYTDASGQIKNISLEKWDMADALQIPEYTLTGEFSIPSKSDLDTYRSVCSQWVAKARNIIVSRTLLEAMLLKNHLKTLILQAPGQTEEEATKIALVFNAKGEIEDESFIELNGMHPTILETLIRAYETEVSLVL
jgi:hypothetical protein